MGLKEKYKIFFAVPFDALTYEFYNSIIPKLKKDFGNIECIIGSEVVHPSSEHENIETFKNQNEQLFKQFVKQIRESDIIITDLTNNNPNVHIELGIALSFNKNILRVCGRELKEVAFDTAGYNIYRYKNQSDLEAKIKKYLEMLFKIKNLNFSNRYEKLYFSDSTKRDIISPWDKSPLRIFPLFSPPVNLPPMKDFKLKLEFRIIEKKEEGDWFGIMVRASKESPFSNGILINSRWNGITEFTLYPEYARPKIEKLYDSQDEKRFYIMEIEIENEQIKATNPRSGQFIRFDNLTNVNFGSIFIMAYNTKVEWQNLEVICRDTIIPETQYL